MSKEKEKGFKGFWNRRSWWTKIPIAIGLVLTCPVWVPCWLFWQAVKLIWRGITKPFRMLWGLVAGGSGYKFAKDPDKGLEWARAEWKSDLKGRVESDCPIDDKYYNAYSEIWRSRQRGCSFINLITLLMFAKHYDYSFEESVYLLATSGRRFCVCGYLFTLRIVGITDIEGCSRHRSDSIDPSHFIYLEEGMVRSGIVDDYSEALDLFRKVERAYSTMRDSARESGSWMDSDMPKEAKELQATLS